jgi:hypothetical protein
LLKSESEWNSVPLSRAGTQAAKDTKTLGSIDEACYTTMKIV